MSLLATTQSEFEALFQAEMFKFFPTEEPINEAILYSLTAGGKRIRPLLVLGAAQLLGGRREVAEMASCAIEMLHTYSLIHDDLPAMDDDDYRRGRPSNHKQFGEAFAILAGDALLNEAFHFLLVKGEQLGHPKEMLLEMLKVLMQKAGAKGMILGQAIDLSQTDAERIEQKELERLHRLKTGQLIQASLLLGALSAQVKPVPKCWQQLSELGECIGLAFQVMDDILDATASKSELGKTPGKDAEQNKQTFPKLIGLKASRAYACQLHTRAKHILQTLAADPADRELLEEVLELLENRLF